MGIGSSWLNNWLGDVQGTEKLPSGYNRLDLPGLREYLASLATDTKKLSHIIQGLRNDENTSLLTECSTEVLSLPNLTYRPRQTLKDHRCKILGMSALTQGSQGQPAFMTTGQDGILVLWDAQSGMKYEVIAVGRGHCQTTAANPTGRVATAGGLACNIDVYRISEELNRLLDDPLPNYQFIFPNQDLQQAEDDTEYGENTFGGVRGNTKVGNTPKENSTSTEARKSLQSTTNSWETAGDKRRVATLGGHDACVSSQAYLDDEHLISGAYDSKVIQWNIRYGKPISSQTEHSAAVTCVADSALLGPHTFASSGKDGKMVLWDTRLPHNVVVEFQNDNPFDRIAFLPSFPALFSSDSTSFNLWDIRSMARIQEYPSIHGQSQSFSISSSGRLAVVGFDTGACGILDLFKGTWVSNLDGHRDAVSGVDVSGGNIFSASWDGTIRMWEYIK